MRIPTRFFLSIAAGTLIGAAVFASLVWMQLGKPTASSRWCYELLEKKRKLCAAIKGKKLILVGGSNVLFGMRASEIQERTGVPTVNFGLHGALSSPYMLHLAKDVLHPGDTALLALEYSGYERPVKDPLFIDFVMSRDPEYFKRAPLKDRLKWGLTFSTSELLARRSAKKNKASETEIFPYDVKYINEYGDQIGQTFAKRPAVARAIQDVHPVLTNGFSLNSKEAQSIREFCQWAADHHVQVLATFPNVSHRPQYDSPHTDRTIAAIEQLFASLHVPVLGTARESMLPDDQFFDTSYHLTEEAAIERTRRFLPHLESYLKH